MKKIILGILLIYSGALAQTVGKQLEFNSAWGVDYESNMVKNPSAAKNLNDTLKLGATLARDNSAGNKIDGKASFLLDAGALNDYLELDLYAPSDEQTSGNCGFKGLFKGDARLYRAQILDGSSNVLAQTVPLTNETGFREFRVWYPCGASGARKVRITQTEAGTAPAINVGKFYYGRMEPGAGTFPNQFSAKVSSSGVLSTIIDPTNNFDGSTFAPTDTSSFDLKFKNLTSTPNCDVSIDNGATTEATSARKATPGSPTGLSVRTGYSTTSAAFTKFAYPFTITCTKTGSDEVQPAITPDQTDKPYTSFTPVLSTGALASGGNQKYWYMLDGPNMIMYFEYEPGANTGTIGSGSYLITIPGGYSVSSTIATPTGSTTNFGNVYAQLGSGSGQSRTGNVTAASATQITIRLNNGNTNEAPVWGSTTGPLNVAQVRIGFTAIIPIAGRENIRSSSTPLLLNTVYSKYNGTVRKVSGVFAGSTGATNCTTSPCTVHRDFGGISSVTRSAAGSYALTFSEAFPSGKEPVCTCSCLENLVAYRQCSPSLATQTQVYMFCTTGEPVPVGKDAAVQFMCEGGGN